MGRNGLFVSCRLRVLNSLPDHWVCIAIDRGCGFKSVSVAEFRIAGDGSKVLDSLLDHSAWTVAHCGFGCKIVCVAEFKFEGDERTFLAEA